MDAERPIEKLLRVFGKKRRADAGALLELHAADRARLQREVARALAAQEARPAPVPRWWPRLIWAMGCAVLMAGAGWVLWSPRSGRPSQLAMGEKPAEKFAEQKKVVPDVAALRPIAEPKPVPAPVTSTPATPPPSPAKVPQLAATPAPPATSLPQPSAPAAAKWKDQTIGLTPTSAAGAPRRELSDGLAKSEGMKQNSASAVNKPTLSGATKASGPAPAVAALKTVNEPAGRAGTATMMMTNSAGFDLASNNTGAGELYKRVDIGGAKESRDRAMALGGVLASFTVQRNGQRLRIVDQDGSVYTGRLETNVVASANRRSAKAPAATQDKELRGQNLDYFASVVASPEQVFRVTGTNRTLKKLVEFTGTIRLTTQWAPGAAAVNGAPSAFGGQQGRSGGVVTTNFSISGRAVIGGKTQVPIEAGRMP